MNVEIAEIDSDGLRSTTHYFEEVVGLNHVRGDGENDRVHVTMENGNDTIIGRGYGLDIVTVELD